MSVGGSPFGGRGRSVFGGQRSSLGEAAEGGNVDLNLTPLMDVMSNILFFLMASVGASIVALLPASTPTRSETAGGAETPAKQVMVTLQVQKTGFTGSAQNERLTPDELKALRFALPAERATDKNPWGMPYDALTAKLADIKKRYPLSDTVILLPEPQVPYQVIIHTMDAARGVPVVSVGDAKALAGSGSAGDLANLFTKVVISDLVK